MQVDMDQLFQIDMSYPCRGGGTVTGRGAAMVVRSSQQQFGHAQGSMNQVFGSLMEGLKSLGSQQQYMIEQWMGQKNDLPLTMNAGWSRQAPSHSEANNSVLQRLRTLEDTRPATHEKPDLENQPAVTQPPVTQGPLLETKVGPTATFAGIGDKAASTE